MIVFISINFKYIYCDKNLVNDDYFEKYKNFNLNEKVI